MAKKKKSDWTQINFPNDGQHTKGEFNLHCLAQGRNGSTEIKALDIFSSGAGWIRIQPVTRKQGKLMNCWIEVPEDAGTLRELADYFKQLADQKR